MSQTTYNERSWAIDLISEINVWLSSRDIAIKRAGGESTLKTGEGTLFPDVLLFGSTRGGAILQGWELKMPDTPIDDAELIENAKKKAEALGLNSFMVWNVTYAALYQIEGGTPICVKTWDALRHIRERSEVESHLEETYRLLHTILEELTTLFEGGVLRPGTIVDALTGENLTKLLLQSLDPYALRLQQHAVGDYAFADEVTLWWLASKQDFPDETDRWRVLARNNLITLSNKFIFAHVLKKFNRHANRVDLIDEKTSLAEALETFMSISKQADFWNIFSTNMGEALVDAESWRTFQSLNALLKEFDVSDIDNAFIHELLDRLALKTKRKAAGQFATPYPLARLLAQLVVLDPGGVTLDPCCGTGTIARAIYDLKSERGQKHPLDSVWASDKFALPLKMATLTLSDPETMGQLLHIFKADAMELHSGQSVELHDPYDGSITVRDLPQLDYIASNLPFVQYETLRQLNTGASDINTWIGSQLAEDHGGLGGRSDLYAYLPFYFWKLLKDGGRLGIIISNSWLGTDMGKEFFALLQRFYRVEAVVTSGSGRWFANASVVTNILIMTKLASPGEEVEQSIKFATLKCSLDSPALDAEAYEIIRAQLNRDDHPETEVLRYHRYDTAMLRTLEALHLPPSAYFSDLSWFETVRPKLAYLHTLFEINRGERRGWDDMFFPPEGTRIEADYLRPVLKSPRSLGRLVAQHDGLAFCCEASEDELEARGHIHALEWIRSFATKRNGTDMPLPQVLARAGMHWYTMQPHTMADFVTAINFGDRLFFSRCMEPMFVNQRLIRLTKHSDSLDADLTHALLNSILGLFYIEALGFGRGEGALDLNAQKVREAMQVLDPSLLDEAAKAAICAAFAPLLTRDILPLREELEAADRTHFDHRVLAAFGLEDQYELIKRSLLELYTIRTAVNHSVEDHHDAA